MTRIVSMPTMYQGRLFRSRLEARWAAMFDLLGWHWEYEPFVIGGWMPDFAVSRERGWKINSWCRDEYSHVLGRRVPTTLVEVKPALTWAEMSTHRVKLEAALGAPPCEERRRRGELSHDGDYDAWERFFAGLQYNLLLVGATLVTLTDSETDYGRVSLGWWITELVGWDTDYYSCCKLTPCHSSCKTDIIKRKWTEAGNLVMWKRPLVRT